MAQLVPQQSNAEGSRHLDRQVRGGNALMLGHQPLIDMREAGYAPRSVTVMLFPAQDWVTRWNEHPATEGDATIVLNKTDVRRARALDLHFLVGLSPVLVNGPDDETTKAVADRCLACGAGHVIASYFDLELPEHLQLVRIEEMKAEVEHG